MRSTYSVLLVSYMPVSVTGGVRKAVGGYLRYMQFRDQRREPEKQPGLDAFVRYVAHRDRTSPAGRVFGAEGTLTTADRRRLVEYVARSTKGLEPKWVSSRDGKPADRQRAVYQLVISPQDWHGLDLRQITRVAMKQLESDAGAGGLGPWFAAEHRNTAHHHVQIVLAARRELTPGSFSTLIINRARLQRMKEAIWAEIERQRRLERPSPEKAPRRPPPDRLVWRALPPNRRPVLPGLPRRLRLTRFQRPHGHPVRAAVLRIRGVALRYRFQMDRELERELLRREHEAWER